MNTPTFEPSRWEPIRSIFTVCGPRGYVGGALRKSFSAVVAVGATTPAPALVRNFVAVTSAAAAGDALMASTTCAAVLVTALFAPVARLTVIALPVTETLSGADPVAGFTSATAKSLPPCWPHACVVSTTAWACIAAFRPPGVLPVAPDVEPVYGVDVPTIACDLRW